MKKIGIIFAMREELEEFLKHLQVLKEYEIFDLLFYEGVIHGVEVILVESGVGKVNASRSTQILIDNMIVDYIINVGVAGGVDSRLQVLDVVIGESLVQHDFDITAFNHPKGYVPKVGVYLKSDEYLLRIANEVFKKNTSYRVFNGVIASGDIFCTDRKMSEKIHNKFGSLCVEMEGASIAQVCVLSHIPFLVIRSISDTLDGDNKMVYEEFLKHSSEVATFMLEEILKKIGKEKF